MCCFCRGRGGSGPQSPAPPYAPAHLAWHLMTVPSVRKKRLKRILEDEEQMDQSKEKGLRNMLRALEYGKLFTDSVRILGDFQ